MFKGFNVYRFWGSEINKSVDKCVDIIAKKMSDVANGM